MKICVCSNCGCPLQLHERKPPWHCTLDETLFDGIEHVCNGFVPVMSDTKRVSANRKG